MINPLGWLLWSVGLQDRSLKVAFVLCPIVICSYLIGIPYGPTGVAFAYSVAMTLWLVPHVMWCVHGTPVGFGDLMSAVARPLLSGVAAAAAALLVQHLAAPIPYPLVRLALAGAAMGLVYIATLVFVMRQKELYVDLLRGLKGAT